MRRCRSRCGKLVTKDAVEIEPEIKEQLDIILDRPPEKR